MHINSTVKKIIQVIAVIFAIATVVVIMAYAVFNYPVSTPENNPKMGVTFSYLYAQDIGLDWKETFLAMTDDLGVEYVRIPAYWNRIEKTEGEYDFSDLDWQLNMAKDKNLKVTLAVGQKVPRWPECYIPEWINGNDDRRKEAVVEFVEKTIERYKDNEAIIRWQIENEPFLDFGVCPELDVDLLDAEIAAARKTDPSRPIMITDSGELSIWLRAAKRADVFGTTMYREVITEKYGQWEYPIGPNFFKLKKKMIDWLAGQENAVVIELQAEPWVEGWTTNFPLERQFRSMNEDKFVENVEFAKKTEMDEIYLWGVEWWYWLKKNHNHTAIWTEAQNFFNQE